MITTVSVKAHCDENTMVQVTLSSNPPVDGVDPQVLATLDNEDNYIDVVHGSRVISVTEIAKPAAPTAEVSSGGNGPDPD